MTTDDLITAVLFGGIFGFLCGSIPFRAAHGRGQIYLALSGMVVCTVAGMIGGGLLAVPVGYLFKWLAMSLPDRAGAAEAELLRESRRIRDGAPKMAPRGRYTILGTAVVCSRCNKACSKIADHPPSECPHCHRAFDNIPKVQPIRKKWPAATDDDLVPLVTAQMVKTNPRAGCGKPFAERTEYSGKVLRSLRERTIRRTCQDAGVPRKPARRRIRIRCKCRNPLTHPLSGCVLLCSRFPSAIISFSGHRVLVPPARPLPCSVPDSASACLAPSPSHCF